MLTVAAVARRLGVAPSTLRTWDRRYKLGPSEHTAGSHRRYGPDDVARLVVMRRLTLDGVPPAEAAQIALAGPPPDAAVPDERHEPPEAVAVLSSLPALTAARAEGARGGVYGSADSRPLVIPSARRGVDDDGRSDVSETLGGLPESGVQARAGGGRVVALPTGSPQARGLARAAMSLDTAEVARILRDAFRDRGVIHTWETLALPVLQAIGERWRVTGDGIDVEHAFSEAMASELRGVVVSLGRPRNARPVLLACAEGDQHTLPLHVLGAALAEEEVSVRMLGVGMPSPALVAAVRRSGPSAVFVYARLTVDDPSVLGLLPRQRPAPRVLVGGAGWEGTSLPPAVRRVRTLPEAVDQVLCAVHV
jgi:DNA-binding transcriptional MerR regulator